MGGRGAFVVLLSLSLIASTFGGRSGRAQYVDEYHLKAAVLFNLAKFVDWPEDAMPDPSAPFTFCVLGLDPFGSTLDNVLRGHVIGRRPAVLRRIAEVSPGCQVLFIANSEIRRLPAVMEQLVGRSVLTVSEAPDFAARGGMIGLLTDSQRIQFEINPMAVENGHLKISSGLMALASSVVRH